MAQQPNKDPTTADLSRQVEELKADIARLTESLGDYGKAQGRRYATQARGKAQELQGKAGEQAHALRSQAEGQIDDVEDYVRRNPFTAMGIAAAIGLLIGLFNGRR